MKEVFIVTLFIVGWQMARAQDASQMTIPRDSVIQDNLRKADSLQSRFYSNIDSLKQTIPGDSLAHASLNKIDSIQNSFYRSADSLKRVYNKPFTQLDSDTRSIQQKIDSLQNLKLPTTALTRKLDSLQNIRVSKVTELNSKMDQLKSKATKPLKDVTLPPQMAEPLQKLTSSLQAYKLPIPGSGGQGLPLPTNGKLPTIGKIDVSGLNNSNLPGANLPGTGSLKDIKGLSELQNATGKMGEITSATSQATGYVEDIKNIAQGNLDEVKNIDKTIERQVMKLEGTDQLTKGTAEIEKLKETSMLMQNPDSLKEKGVQMAKQEVMKQAVNHFAGQEQVLQQAMDKMSKLKAKYSDVKSIAELPKHPPNPLKGKPFIERIVPGITFQIQKSDYFLLDVNALVLYRIRPHWSAGAGWNQRFAFDGIKIKNEQPVYGPRAVVEFKWKKGINLRAIPELMNAYVPQSPDPSGREWVWSIYAGIKKDFTVYKSIKGNTELLYNLFDQKNNSPYAQRFAVRFGFEFPMKKKKKI